MTESVEKKNEIKSSSSSSDSSSSSSSDSDSDVLLKVDDAEVDDDRNTKHKDTKHEVAAKIQRDQSNFTPFGPHHLTARFTSGNITGYAMACRHPGHLRCSKEMAATVAGGLPQARQALQAWIILGTGLPDREAHMGRDLRQVLTDALKSKSLLPEAKLLEMINSKDTGLESPFLPHMPPDNPSSVALGRPADDVPSAVHEQMLEMAQSGRIPCTTLAQRERNRRHASNYRVPNELELCFQYGYISPNLPPPAGVKWVCRAGEWTLVPRGG